MLSKFLLVLHLIKNLLFNLDEPAVGAAASEASALASAASTASAVASAAIGEQPPSGNVIVDEPYLKEHVVGILFSRSKLTHLQVCLSF